MDIISTLRGSGLTLAQVALAIGTSPSYLSQMLHARKPWAPRYCAAIETLTKGAVTRQALRPTDYWLIWPELAPPSASPNPAPSTPSNPF